MQSRSAVADLLSSWILKGASGNGIVLLVICKLLTKPVKTDSHSSSGVSKHDIGALHLMGLYITIEFSHLLILNRNITVLQIFLIIFLCFVLFSSQPKWCCVIFGLVFKIVWQYPYLAG